ncbi:DUF6155 family protein [Clostridium brassicae]|uniref:DUF6155 family protein n=1 Tax=Clostridium brassicae TaxID=2999072 RepID=A0ABT4D5E4_9CLOT|nr:DUF6155 family protein [Clostridium brassicae]MCY6957502.1 DUF6155 family protein [Clostridium brassicae]
MNSKYIQYIGSIKEDELKREILELIKLFPEVREYYDLRIDPELEKNMLDRYKKVIKNEFFPEKEDIKMRYSVVSETIIDFQRRALIPDNSIELMLYYVEIALDFTKLYGDIGEKFYISVEGTFDKALNYIFKKGLERKFYSKIKELLDRTSYIEGDFQTNMVEIFYKYFDL